MKADNPEGSMTFEEKLLVRIRELSLEKQREVLDFVNSLNVSAENSTGALGVGVLDGLWADLDLRITEEDIQQARREMWGNFPQEVEM